MFTRSLTWTSYGTFLIITSLWSVALMQPAGGRPPEKRKLPAPLAEGHKGSRVGTTGAKAVRAGLAMLEKGGTAADAAVATALTQVVECAGSYVSHAGIFRLVYHDARTGRTYSLNACYNTALAEK